MGFDIFFPKPSPYGEGGFKKLGIAGRVETFLELVSHERADIFPDQLVTDIIVDQQQTWFSYCPTIKGLIESSRFFHIIFY